MDDERHDTLREEQRRQPRLLTREQMRYYGRAAELSPGRLVAYAVILVVLIGAAVFVLGGR
jgi:hypothetical protein